MPQPSEAHGPTWRCLAPLGGGFANAWFESNARSGFVKSVYSFKTDRIKVPDDF
jgi:hypothetical protein